MSDDLTWLEFRCETLKVENEELRAEIASLKVERYALRDASKAVVDFVDGPDEAKRPDVFFRLIGDLRAAIDPARETVK